MKVLFAPDWRAGGPYQQFLADALRKEDVEVLFFRHYYKRVFPLARLMKVQQREQPCDLLHLHWPEAYYPQQGDRFDWFRLARFSTDLALATRRCPLVLTAHNLKAHNRDGEPFELHNMGAAMCRARRVFAHSAPAAAAIRARFPIAAERVCLIPFGDQAVTLGLPLPQAAAREELGLPAERKVCLFFGALQPYKGVEEVLSYWREAHPETLLVVAGEPMNPEYGRTIAALADADRVRLDLQWLDDARLRLWLSAADAVVFNYRSIFTSGAACLARSYGVPVLLPTRLDTVELQEPSPLVFRFASFAADFATQLARALATGPDYAGAHRWRDSTTWEKVAAATAVAYRESVEAPSKS